MLNSIDRLLRLPPPHPRSTTEQTWVENKIKFTAIFESSPAAIGITRLSDNRIVDVNKAWEKMTGYLRSEVIEHHVIEFDLWVQPEQREQLTTRLNKHQVPVRDEVLVRKKSGKICHVLLSMEIIELSGERYLVYMGQDITDIKRVEEELRKSEDRFRQLFENMCSGVAVYEAVDDGDDFIFKDFNRSAEIIEHIKRDDVLGKRVTEIFPGVKEFGILDVFQRVWKSGQAEYFEPHLYENGNDLGTWRESWVYKLPSGEVVAIYNNITDRKQVENELKSKQELLFEITRQVPGVIYQFYSRPDGEMGLYYISERAEQVMGLKPDVTEFFERFTELVIPEHREAFLSSIQKAIKEIRPWNFQGMLQKPTGEQIYFSGHSTPSVRETEVVFNGIILDITLQKEAETTHKKLQAQLMQTQRLEAIGTLAGGVAHDFNNMLSIIVGYAELAMQRMSPGEPFYTDMMEIFKAARRSSDITRQLLAFARQQATSPKVLDLNENIENMLKMLRRLIVEDIELAWLPCRDLRPVKIDPSQIDQILANLCVNARDAMEGKGKLTIETRNTCFDEEYCAAHPGFLPGNFVLLAVSDTGRGIMPEMMDKIFEPFFTTKGLHQGTGLGLSTVYGIVKQNNGFINVYSEPGEGTTIKIYLPQHMKQADETQREGEPELPLSRGEIILLVEDDEAILKLSEKMLNSLGYTALTANTPGEAIDLAKKNAEKINLLITDVVMPEMNGRELSEQLKKQIPNLKTLFMSGYTANVIANRGVLEDGVYFIPKPISRKALAEKIRETLDSA